MKVDRRTCTASRLPLDLTDASLSVPIGLSLHSGLSAELGLGCRYSEQRVAAELAAVRVIGCSPSDCNCSFSN